MEFYQQNELSDSFPEVNTTLVHPYKTILYVAELVEFYQQNELSDSFPEVNTTLVHPYKTI